MHKMRPLLKELLDLLAEHDREQVRPRPGQDSHSLRTHLSFLTAEWFHIGKGLDLGYVLRKFDEQLGDSTKILADAVAAGFVNQPTSAGELAAAEDRQGDAPAPSAGSKNSELGAPPDPEAASKQTRRSERARIHATAANIVESFRS